MGGGGDCACKTMYPRACVNISYQLWKCVHVSREDSIVMLVFYIRKSSFIKCSATIEVIARVLTGTGNTNLSGVAVHLRVETNQNIALCLF